jgi:uncharacterized cupredoxin-like copper-binding protein
MNKFVPIVILAILLVAVALLLLPQSGVAQSGNLVALQITDPAQVPAGTQSLVIAYSSLAVHLSNASGSSGWVSSNSTGSVNLLAVLNLTQTIGTVSVPANASIDMVRFTVSSANITVNGTTYNVTVPSGMLTAHVTGRTSVSGGASVLLDLSPVVASIVTNTTTVFVLVPSLRAVVVGGGSNSATLHVGARARLSENETAELEQTRPNVSITAASLSVSPGNVTNFSITLKDNSNESVVVKHVGFKGNLSVQFNSSALAARANAFIANMTKRITNSTFCTIANITQHIGAGANQSSEHMVANITQHIGAGANLSSEQKDAIESLLEHSSFGSHIPNFSVNVGEGEGVRINSSICTPSGLANFTSRLQHIVLNSSEEIEHEQSERQIMIFSVESNGTLTVPLGTDDFENSSASYTLQPGQSATLSFSGVITFGHGMFMVVPKSGSAYEVGAQIEEFGIVFKNITAT